MARLLGGAVEHALRRLGCARVGAGLGQVRSDRNSMWDVCTSLGSFASKRDRRPDSIPSSRRRNNDLVEFFDEDRTVVRDFAESGLHVYSHPGRPAAQELVVFVHGYNGSGYETWRSIPTIILQHDAEPRAIAVYDYVSGLRRTKADSPSIENIVDHLVDELDSLTAFKKVTLVGHSMGGVIAMAAIREKAQRPVSSGGAAGSFNAVFTLASPLAGTKWLPYGIIPIKERGALKIHSSMQRENLKFFKNWVNSNAEDVENRRYWIPHFTAKATGDRVVDRFSSTFVSADSENKTFRGSHSSFLEGSGVANWIVLRLREVQRARRRAMLAPSRRVASLRTAFRGDARFAEWVDAYHSARQEFSLREEMPTEDLSGQELARSLDLLVRVLPAGEVETPPSKEAVASDAAFQEGGGTRALGISPFGGDPSAAVLAIRQLLEKPSNQWVAGTTTQAELQAEVVRWLGFVHKLAPQMIAPSTPKTDTQLWSSSLDEEY